jgi:hypothetical protein
LQVHTRRDRTVGGHNGQATPRHPSSENSTRLFEEAGEEMLWYLGGHNGGFRGILP